MRENVRFMGPDGNGFAYGMMVQVEELSPSLNRYTFNEGEVHADVKKGDLIETLETPAGFKYFKGTIIEVRSMRIPGTLAGHYKTEMLVQVTSTRKLFKQGKDIDGPPDITIKDGLAMGVGDVVNPVVTKEKKAGPLSKIFKG